MSNREWFSAATLPTPGVPLLLRVNKGLAVDVVEGVRPAYVESRDQSDLGYETADGEKLLNVIEWSML